MANLKDKLKESAVLDYLENGNAEEVAQRHGVSVRTLFRWSQKHKHKTEYGIKDDQRLKGVSTYTPVRDDDGTLLSATWTKVDVEYDDAVDKLKAVAEGLIDTIKPVKPKPFKGSCKDKLCSAYIISDFHLGQYSSLKEVGESWSLDEAFDTICGWIDAAILASPPSKQAVLVDLGDFLHADGMLPCTPASGHILDASGRFHEVIDVSIAIFDYMINALMEHHENVHVIVCEGNHNMDSAHWMSRCIARKYENEPRVTFDLTDIPYYVFKWGKVMLGFHHGHKKRVGQIAESIIASFRKIYGATRYHYIHTGHLHHREIKESSLAVVEQHSTLAAKDAYSARGGYHSERGANTITYHEDFGEVARTTIRPEMLV